MREFEKGARVAGYRIEEMLTRGASRALYRAREESSGRVVTLRLVEVDDPAVAERMARVAGVYGAVAHPNLLPVYDTGEWAGLFYVTTRPVVSTLAGIIGRDGTMTSEQVISLAVQVASASVELRRGGLAVTALTPDALLVGAEDRVYLASALLEPIHLAAEVGGIVTGVREEDPYMAPERIEGGGASPRTNVYELGVTVYTALAGEPPTRQGAAERRSEAAGLAAHVTSVRPELDAEWDRVLARAMAVEPQQRFDSPLALARSLPTTFQLVRGRTPRSSRSSRSSSGLVVPGFGMPDAADEARPPIETARPSAPPANPTAPRVPDTGAGAPVGPAAEPTAPPDLPPPEAPPPGGERPDEPPRSAHARLEAPNSVVSGDSFPVVVGLSAAPQAGVFGETLRVPDSVEGTYTLAVQLVADGFGLAGDGDWRVEMPVTGEEPYPTRTLHLRAEPQDDPVLPRALQALYSINGQTIGLAFRPIAVLRDTAQTAPQLEPVDPGFAVSLPEGWTPPDLTVRILRGKAEDAGRLLWTFETKHPGITVPHEELVSDIGEDPASFASREIRSMPTYEGSKALYQFVAGLGATVADHIPEQFWALLALAAKEAGDTPSVLILSSEPHVPWELAQMEEPLQPDVPPFLSAQARVGRWVLGPRRPKMPPPIQADADSMAVISGVYTKPGWKRLEEAEAEAAELKDRYQATPVTAKLDEVLRCIEGDPSTDVLHFSVHGQYDPSGIQDGLVLVDGKTLDPIVVKGTRFTSPRFVFLNACQVGQGYEVLGDYAGLAASFLYAGAAAVVAPLWAIDDKMARKLASDFYKAAFSGQSPADILRSQRADFKRDSQPESSTCMAYQFFGHPDMHLVRS